MADAVVEPRPIIRYFCHRCSIEFEEVLQDFTCPYCAGGFIEQLDGCTEAFGQGNHFNDADMSAIEDMNSMDDMSNLDDSDDTHNMAPPMLNDLAFLMTGGRLRNRNGGSGGSGGGSGGGGSAGGGGAAPQPADGAPRRNTLMEELVWMIGGSRPGTGAVTAGAPLLFVGAPGDYVFGGEGLDAVVTQLLGQLENAGPPPMPRDRLAALLDEPVSEEQAASNTTCSVCWDVFSLGEVVCRLECEHIFHSACIRPWLQLHATCPICRRSLLPDPPAAPASVTASVSATSTNTTTTTNTANTSEPPGATIRTSIAAALPRILLRRIIHHPPPRSGSENRDSSSSTSSRASLARPGAAASVWMLRNDPPSNSNSSTSTASVISDIERNYNMDLDMD